MSSHINGKVLKFKKQLEQEGFCIDIRDNCWRIYKIGQPFYSFHPAEKGIQPCMRWIKATYKIDLNPRQQKSKKKMNQKEIMQMNHEKIQSLEQRLKLSNDRFTELVAFLQRRHQDVFEEFMERYE